MSSLLPSLLHLHLHPSSTANSSSLVSLPLSSPQPSTTTTTNNNNNNKNKKKKKIASLRSRLSRLCKQGRVEQARLFFDSLPRPVPTLLWNTLLIGYICNSLPHHALLLFSLMMKMNQLHPPDAYTYSSALKACAATRRLSLGKAIHCHVIRRPSFTHINIDSCFLYNSLLNMYANSISQPEPSQIDVVRVLFDRMPNRNVVSWNTLIGWYVKTGRPYDALLILKQMLEFGVRPSTVSFINVFPAAVFAEECCRRCGDLLYGLLIKHGKEFFNLFVVSSVISMFAGLGDIDSARKVFDQTEEKSTEVWNTMISGYEQNGLYTEAIDLFTQILGSDNVSADSVTFLSTLMAISQLQDVKFGQQVHAYLLKEKLLQLPVILCNALIVLYSRCGQVRTAFKLFSQMQERDAVSWNTMVTALVQHDLNIEGLLLTHEMKKEGVSVDSVTLTALLSAASNMGSLRIGRETHGYLVRHGIRWEGMESYLIDMYSKSGCIEKAHKLFDNCQPSKRDQVTWNSMIAGYTQNGQSDQAKSIFRAMIEEGNNKPNSVTLSSVLPACDPTAGGMQFSKQIHGFAIRHCFDKNIFVGTSLVDLYSKCGDILYAEKVFDNMPERNKITYTTLLSGFGQHGLGSKALTLFQSMQEDQDIMPDGVAFLAAISACRHSGLVDEGLYLYESMEKFGIEPTPDHHCSVVDMLARAGRVDEAFKLAESLGEDAKFVAIWGCILAACKEHGKLELGKLVSERIFEIEKEYGVVAGYRVLLSNLYASEEDWDSVDRVRREMRERRLRKETASSFTQFGMR